MFTSNNILHFIYVLENMMGRMILKDVLSEAEEMYLDTEESDIKQRFQSLIHTTG